MEGCQRELLNFRISRIYKVWTFHQTLSTHFYYLDVPQNPIYGSQGISPNGI